MVVYSDQGLADVSIPSYEAFAAIHRNLFLQDAALHSCLIVVGRP
jgi:hypothetical protein